MDNGDCESSKGLTTKNALNRLHDDISYHLNEFEISNNRNRNYFQNLLLETFHHNRLRSLFRWTSILILTCCSFALFTAYFHGEERNVSLILQGVFILCVISINSCAVGWENNLRHNEMVNLARKLVSDLKDYISSVHWERKNYPHLHSPLSPCITLQWTLRDEHVVNLPWALLVRGDVILLRPGQKVPGKCHPLEMKDKLDEQYVLYFGDVYSPYLEGVGEGVSSPKARPPLEEKRYIMLETPFLINFRIMFEEALNRPVTLFVKKGYYLLAVGLEFVCLPVIALLTLMCNIVRIYYNVWPSHWTETLLVVLFSTILPLVPFLVPVAWTVLHWAGTASILTVCNQAKTVQRTVSEDPFEGGELDDLDLSEQKCDWRKVKQQFINIVLGKQDVPIRSASLLHVLASITNLCCLDKKGILSWPNPTAEKLFFLHHKVHNLSRSNIYSSNSLFSEEEQSGEDNTTNACNDGAAQINEPDCVLMSLTHDHLTAFGLQFDDLSWKKYLFSLKPLGLSILLNTCNPATQNHYTKFCSHITCEAMYNEDLVPVSQRRCLCELPKQMGFKTKASEPFRLEHQLCTFRHVPSGMECKDRLARSLSITKLKFPFPHMVSVLLRDKCSGKVEIMSQGTTDIILDSCTDYWDGFDVRPLTDKERKKILDFYHRTSLSGYCTAFSYRPTACEVKSDLSTMYMELPIDPSHIYQMVRTPTPHCSTEALFGDNKHTECEEITDIDGCLKMQCKQIFIGMVTMQYQARTDMVRMIEELEASCIRFVHFSKENELRSRVFSEKMGLESGWNCHISLLSDRTKPESGSSSRTGQTSSKISGLTHIGHSTEIFHSQELNNIRLINGRSFCRSKSLRRKCVALFRSNLEVSRTLSHSAPSAINLDVAQVKFDDDVSVCSHSSGSSSGSYTDEENEKKRLIECPWHSDKDKCDGLNNSSKLVPEISCTNGRNLLLSPKTLRMSLSSSNLRSPSQEFTSSSDQTASLKMFDMSNRARLPKGIENIRPHLENVDNVPLLVSLFTDCTTPTTKEMLVIMQSYTEVVVVIGSTANAENMTLFMQADLCIGIAPSYPQVCMREPVFIRTSSKMPSPSELAQRLNSLPCSLSFERDDRISMVQLILKSRNFMEHFMSCFQFWASCNISISLLQFIFVAAFLPPILSSGDVLWLISVPVPLLSISLAFAPPNPAVMNQATGKNDAVINKESLKYVLFYYAPKFVPSLVVVVFSSIWIFYSFCRQISDSDSCDYIYPRNSSLGSSSGVGWGSNNHYSLNIVQKIVAFQLVLYFGIISLTFVHRMYQVWNKNPLSNKIWAAAFIVVMVLQIVYTSISFTAINRFNSASVDPLPGLLEIPLCPFLVSVLWPLFLLPLNELIKRTEIRVNVRYQKRAKLEFGTKLGMNSPF